MGQVYFADLSRGCFIKHKIVGISKIESYLSSIMMRSIFSMDEEEEVISNLFSRAMNLNYKILETEVEDTEPEIQEDTISDLPVAIPIKRDKRSNSGSHTRPSSYEIGIGESFVSSLNKSVTSFDDYRPQASDFEQLKVLGKGAYGKVILVRERSTGRLFAQKQLKKVSLIINENEIHQTNFNRTLNERNILESVLHPSIVKLYYAFQDRDKVYLILEYLAGGELFNHLAQEKFMSEKNAAFYIAQIILALRYLHTQLGVIYRDLKPENCMLNYLGNLVLTDFGLSKVSTAEKRKHSITGTAQYMAPEVLRNEPYSFAVDWWSLGCVAYDLLTGSPPFSGNNNKKIMEKILSSKKSLKYPFYLSADAKDFLRKLLNPNADKRIDIDNNFDYVKKHRFFRNIDWDVLEDPSRSTETCPPIIPVITDPILAENFDLEFTDMALTPPNHFDLFLLEKVHPDILQLKNFTFKNEGYLSTRLK